ncbi:hypothetical protein [Streptomyces sp. NPDC058891]|uniref:hypothetical protein n=1 Tax=Streptomyces sp. NPDC058891 TaxID=3346667 RepID=UPI00367535EE
MTTAVRQTRRYAAALLLAASLAGASSCNAQQPNDSAQPAETPNARTASPSKPPSSSSRGEEALVIAAYTDSWDAQTEAYRRASSAGTSLKKSTTLRALADVESDLSAMRKAGQVTIGRPVIHPRVIKVTSGEIPQATVSDCVDTTNWALVDKASRKKVPLPTGRLAKYITTASLEKWGTKWMVTKLTAQDRAC